MTDREFCKLHNSYCGDAIDKPKQLVSHSFSGKELKEYTEHVKTWYEENKTNQAATILQLLVNACGAEFENEELAVQIIAANLSMNNDTKNLQTIKT